MTEIERDILGVGVHDWFVPESIGYECCRKCGVVRRADDMNKPCRGRVVLSLRDEYTEGQKPDCPPSSNPTERPHSRPLCDTPTPPTPESELVARLRVRALSFREHDRFPDTGGLLDQATTTIERLHSAHEQGRRDGIEMAARACDEIAACYVADAQDAKSKGDHSLASGHLAQVSGARKCATAIRALSSAPPGEKRKPVRVDVTKEWCMAAAHAEGDSEIGAGALAREPAAPPEKGERIPSGEDAVSEAQEDACQFGIGFTRTHPDGRVEHIPPEEVFIHGNTIKAETSPPAKAEDRDAGGC